MCFLAALPGLGALFGGAGGATGGIATALQAVGTLAGAGASIAGGIQSNNVAKYNSKVAENNAQAERQRASYEANLQRENVRRVIGAQRAAGASSGLDITSGTPVAVLGDTAKAGEMDVLARLYAGESAGVAYENDAQRMRAEGKAAKTAGFINAGTNLLSGFGKMAASNKYRALA
jgi:hypothetical protein